MEFWQIILYAFIAIVVLVGGFALALWLYVKKNRKIYYFNLREKNNLANPKTYQGHTKKDEAGKLHFYVPDIDLKLDIIEPHQKIDGKEYWEIMRRKDGTVGYAKALVVNEKEDMEFGVSLEERELAFNKMRKFSNRYDTVFNKAQNALILSMILMTIIVVGGMIAVIVLNYNGISKMGQAVKEIKPIAADLNRAATANLKTAEIYQSILTNNKTFIRQIN